VAARATTAPARVTESTPSPSKPRASLLPAERLLLGQLLAGNADAANALATLSVADLEGLGSARILTAAVTLKEGGRVPDLPALEAVLDDDDRRFLRELAVSATVAGVQSPGECVRALKEMAIDRRLAEVQKRLERASGDDKLEALLQEKAALLREKRASQGA
jgi:hypothetical protein